MRKTIYSIVMTILFTSCGGYFYKEEIIINLQEKGAAVSESMYDVFLDEINYAGDQILGFSSYYVQKMAAENRPTYNVELNRTVSDSQTEEYSKGQIGFGSWETQVEFKDIAVTENGKIINLDITQSPEIRGNWKIENGVLSQTSNDTATKYILDGFRGNNCIVECKVRKIGGKEGFFIYFGLNKDRKKGFIYNVAGWNNSRTAIELMSDGCNSGVVAKSIAHKMDTNKWYDIRIIITPRKSELYVDDNLILSHTPKSTPLHFISSGYDQPSGEVIVKVVNVGETDYRTTIKLRGVNEVDKNGKIISLTAKNGGMKNTLNESKKTYPNESEYKDFGKDFDFKFPPFSYTILRVKVK